MYALLLVLLLVVAGSCGVDDAHDDVHLLDLPRVHYVTECGCTGLEQEALVFLSALAPLRSLRYGARWLSVNHCRNRCPHTPPEVLALQQTPAQLALSLSPVSSSSATSASTTISPTRPPASSSTPPGSWRTADSLPYSPTGHSLLHPISLLHAAGVKLCNHLPSCVRTPLSQMWRRAGALLSSGGVNEPESYTDDRDEPRAELALDVLIEHVAFRGVCPTRQVASWPPVRRRICRSMNECDAVDQRTAQRCNQHCDEVWVPSHFHWESFAAAGVRPTQLWVLPEAFDPRLLLLGKRHPESRRAPEPCPNMIKDRFVFMSVFKVGSSWHPHCCVSVECV
jgi:hypothetical protein